MAPRFSRVYASACPVPETSGVETRGRATVSALQLRGYKLARFASMLQCTQL